MPTENTLVIRDFASLSLWGQQLRSTMWSQNLPTVQFQLQEFSFEQNQSFSALASSYQNACGCGSGSFFMSVTVVAVAVSYFTSGKHISDITLLQILSFVGVVVLSSIAGKLLGLLWARWRLLTLATSVRRMIVKAAPMRSY